MENDNEKIEAVKTVEIVWHRVFEKTKLWDEETRNIKVKYDVDKNGDVIWDSENFLLTNGMWSKDIEDKLRPRRPNTKWEMPSWEEFGNSIHFGRYIKNELGLKYVGKPERKPRPSDPELMKSFKGGVKVFNPFV